MVVGALQSPYAQSSAKVLGQGLKAVANLAKESPFVQAQLGELGACEGAIKSSSLAVALVSTFCAS